MSWTFVPMQRNGNPMKKIEFHFDFGSPNAYLSHLVIPAIEARTGAKFDYVPVLLGGVFKATNNVSPMISLQGIRNKPEYGQLEMKRFLVRYGVTEFQFNPHFPVNTLGIMRGAVVAEQEGYAPKYISVVYNSMWSDPKKMDDPEVIAEVLNAGGLDGAHILARTQDPEVKSTLVDNTAASVERGTFGSPTFYVGEQIFFGKDSLQDVEEEILK
jgi:2-hydroxychromene-2-carboxylate isomerase